MSEYSSHASLETLPAELVSPIAASLDLDSIRAVRLVSKALERSFFEVFRVYLRTKHIVLALDSVRHIMKDLQNDGAARYMEEIIIMGQSIEDSPRLLRLLGTTLMLARTKGHLHSMDIEASRDGLIIVLMALQATGIPLRTLRIYPYGGGYTTAMDYYRMDNLHALAPTLQLVKEFSWSLTSIFQRAGDREGGSVTTGIQNVDAINQILIMAGATEKLELTWYKTAPLREPEAYFFETCFESVLAMTRLEECSLRGLYVTELTLQKFLQRTTATVIKLTAIYLRPGGEYRPIFDVITSGKFHKVVLDDLWQHRYTTMGEDYAKILFNMVSRLKPGARNLLGPSTVTREGEAVHMKLEYSLGRSLADRTPYARALSMAIYGSD